MCILCLVCKLGKACWRRCELVEDGRPLPGPQDSLADALEGGLPADTAAVSVDATLERQRECKGIDWSHRATQPVWEACLHQPGPGLGKNLANTSLPFQVTQSGAPAEGQALLSLLQLEKQKGPSHHKQHPRCTSHPAEPFADTSSGHTGTAGG